MLDFEKTLPKVTEPHQVALQFAGDSDLESDGATLDPYQVRAPQWHARSERFEDNMTSLAARASESVDSCTLDGLTVPAIGISERVASQASFGHGGEA